MSVRQCTTPSTRAPRLPAALAIGRDRHRTVDVSSASTVAPRLLHTRSVDVTSASTDVYHYLLHNLAIVAEDRAHPPRIHHSLDIGGGAMKRPRRGDCLMGIVDTNGADSLNRNGVATFPLPNDLDSDAYVKDLRACSKTWFDTNFAMMLREPPPIMYDHPDLVASKTEWDLLSPDVQNAAINRMDLGKDEGMQLVFDSSYISKQKWFIDLQGSKSFFRKAAMYAKMGNSAMAMGSMAGWTAKGFGFWAQIVPDYGLAMLTEALQIMRKLGLEPGEPAHFPHPIYKPPSGTALEIHHDQMAPSELLENLRVHVNSDDASTCAWMRKHGVQMLAHLHGGTGPSDGATFVVGPMTPAKLLIVLEAYSTGKFGGNYQAWIKRGVGKIDLDIELHLNSINKLLAIKGHCAIGLLPAVPLRSVERQNGFILAFPVGWLHGSFANAALENPSEAKGSRISITLPITTRDSTQVADKRIPTRLSHMATLSTAGHSVSEYNDAEKWLLEDTDQYATGVTHQHPESVCDLIRHPNAPGKEGPFHSIIVKKETVDAYIEELAHLGTQHAAMSAASASACAPTNPGMPSNELMPGCHDVIDLTGEDAADATTPHAQPVPTPDAPARSVAYQRTYYLPTHGGHVTSHTPPHISVLEEDVRLVKIKQPWAEMLVLGIKNIENRGWPLAKPAKLPVWMIVCSSKERPSGATMNDLKDLLKQFSHPLAESNSMDPAEYVYGAMLGMIKIEECTRNPPPSVWHEPCKVGWVVSDAWRFDEPIPLDEDDGSQTQVRLAIRPQYKLRIIEAMAKFEECLR